MSFKLFRHSSLGSRITDLLVLSGSFMAFVYLMDFTVSPDLILDMAFYVAVVFVCLRLARRVFFDRVGYSTRAFNVVLGNGSGLLVGALLVSLANYFVPFLNDAVVVVICASFLAFFILGTLAPLIKSSRNDRMIHH